MKPNIENIGIAAIGCYTPKQYITSQELAERGGFPAHLLLDKTGVDKIALAGKGENVVTMAVEAVQAALLKAQLKAADIDLIIFCTSAYAYGAYPPAAALAMQCGMSNAFCFELINQCNGALVGLNAARQMMTSSKQYNTALVIASDIPSRHIDPNDHTTTSIMTMGDMATAAILTKDNLQNRLGSFYAFTDTEALSLIAMPAFEDVPRLHFKIKDHYQLAEIMQHNYVRNYIRAITAVLSMDRHSAQDVDYLFINQFHQYTTRQIFNYFNISPNKRIEILRHYGHLTSSDVLLGLSQALDKKLLQQPSLVVLAASGGAHSWSAMTLELLKKEVTHD